ADFRLLAPHRVNRRIVATHPRGLPAARRRGRRLGRRSKCQRRLAPAAAPAQNQRRPGPPDRARQWRLRAIAENWPQPPEIADDLFVDALLHRLEEIEALLLVLDERIALAVPAKADAFFQMIEAVEVILPLLIDNLQHDVALDALQDLAADELLLL